MNDQSTSELSDAVAGVQKEIRFATTQLTFIREDLARSRARSTSAVQIAVGIWLGWLFIVVTVCVLAFTGVIGSMAVMWAAANAAASK